MNKLQGKDLINVGIFTAIYFVVMMAIAMLGFIPIFLPLLIVLVPLIGGIVMMLYYSKVQKFGMVSLTGLICGILMLLTGMGYWSIITGAVFGVLADLVLKLLLTDRSILLYGRQSFLRFLLLLRKIRFRLYRL